MVVIHGDDFTALGHEKDLDWYREQIQVRMDTKVKGRLGPGKNDMKHNAGTEQDNRVEGEHHIL